MTMNPLPFCLKADLDPKTYGTQMRKVIHISYSFVSTFIHNRLFKSVIQSIHYRTLRKVITIAGVCGYGFFCVDVLASSEPKKSFGLDYPQSPYKISSGFPLQNPYYVKLTKLTKSFESRPINHFSAHYSGSVQDMGRLAEAIKIAENSRNKPYGIMRDYCTAKTEAKCLKGCLQTIHKRYALYLKTDRSEDFISYLSRSYAPLSAPNDPHGLNSNWTKNVTYFYNKLEGAHGH